MLFLTIQFYCAFVEGYLLQWKFPFDTCTLLFLCPLECLIDWSIRLCFTFDNQHCSPCATLLVSRQIFDLLYCYFYLLLHRPKSYVLQRNYSLILLFPKESLTTSPPPFFKILGWRETQLLTTITIQWDLNLSQTRIKDLTINFALKQFVLTN